MKRMAFLLVVVAATACASPPKTWTRMDGKPQSQEQLSVDETICRGESQKAKLSSTMREGVTIGEQGLYSPRQQAISDVYSGCMAQHGWVQPIP